jgi:hypothetical protein
MTHKRHWGVILGVAALVLMGIGGVVLTLTTNY